jgi:PHD/YefM family antitoxin component YafN of YafNO toxin-antitoxin module
MALKGIQFLVDDGGDKTAVVIDLKRYRRLWEDVYDRLLVESRAEEPRESLEQVRSRLEREWKRANG